MGWTRAWALAAGLLTAGNATLPAQADSRLYHKALYLEHVQRKPEEALERLRELCRLYPESSFRRLALARQADLLRRLNRPGEAADILALLEKEGLVRSAQTDRTLLRTGAEGLRAREELLAQIRVLQARLAEVRQALEELRAKSPEDPEVKRLQESAGKLEEELQALRPRVTASPPRPLQVKREALARWGPPPESHQLFSEIARLREEVRALRNKGNLAEAQAAERELQRLEARLPNPGRGMPPLTQEEKKLLLEALERAREDETAGRQQPGVWFLLPRLLATPGEPGRLTLQQRQGLIRVFTQLVARFLKEAEGRGDRSWPGQLRAASEAVQKLDPTLEPREWEAQLQELQHLFTPPRFGRRGPRPPGPPSGFPPGSTPGATPGSTPGHSRPPQPPPDNRPRGGRL